MTDKLPAIDLPDTPLPDEWQAYVNAVAERCRMVEQWAEEMRERSLYALRRYEDTTIALDQLLDERRTEEAHAAIRVAAEGIKQQRAAAGETSH